MIIIMVRGFEWEISGSPSGVWGLSRADHKYR